MPDVVVRPELEEDQPALVELLGALSSPFPAITLDEYRGQIATVPPGVPFLRLVAEIEGEIVGGASMLRMFWSEHPTSFNADVNVREDRWGQGIGSQLYDHILEAATSFGAQRIYTHVRETRTRSIRFATDRGFKETGIVHRMSRLDVRTVNREGYDGLEEKLNAGGIRVATLAELGPEDESVLRAVHASAIASMQDEPTSEPFNMTFELWRDSFLAQPGVTPEAIWVALDGDRPIGVTTLARQAGNNGWHDGLGVERPYRGRGIARLLKIKTIEYAQANGIDYLYTGNDINNPRMYDINVRLGYQPLPSNVEFVKEMASAS